MIPWLVWNKWKKVILLLGKTGCRFYLLDRTWTPGKWYRHIVMSYITYTYSLITSFKVGLKVKQQNAVLWSREMINFSSCFRSWSEHFHDVFYLPQPLFHACMLSLTALDPPANSLESHTLLSWSCAILKETRKIR